MDTVPYLIDQQAIACPHNIAIVDDHTSLTYEKLSKYSTKLSLLLIASDKPIGLYLNRGADVVIAKLAILKAGGFYVTLDTAYPPSRLKEIIEDASIEMIIAHPDTKDALSSLGYDKDVVMVNSYSYSYNKDEPCANNYKHTGDDLCYLMYTSGSSGKPKGVMIEHKGLTNMAKYGGSEVYKLSSSSRVMVFGSINFDAIAWELWPPLLFGSTLYIIPEKLRTDTIGLSAYINKHAITDTFLPPTILAELSRDILIPSLSTIVVAGEPCPEHLLSFWSKGRTVINAFGSAETTVCCSTSKYQVGDKHTKIGKAIFNTKLFVLDPLTLSPVKQGTVGELCVSGIGLSRGYWKQPILTATQFPVIKIGKEEVRVYRTGDMVQQEPDLSLIFVGREDRQVKILGKRIELEEIEAILSAYEGISQSIVILKRSMPPILVGYIKTPYKIDLEAVKKYMLSRLPYYFVPSAMTFIHNIPLTANDKIDYSSLPDIELSFAPAETEMEHRLIDIWKNVLQCSDIGIYNSFFQLGGDSIGCVKMVAILKNSINQDVRVRHIYECPVLKDLALALEDLEIHRKRMNSLIDFSKEKILDPQICISPDNIPLVTIPENILLTGGTGYIGAFILNELLVQTKANIYCLVRAKTIAEGLLRLCNTLKTYMIWNDSFANRIIPVLGDLGTPLLGLSSTDFEQLASTLDSIYHCGANVNFTISYSQLRAANVGGTATLLKLASMVKTKSFHFVSSMAIFGSGFNFTQCKRVYEDSDISFAEKYLHLEIAYSQSKWLSETYVWEAKKRGFPITVFRPGFVFCDSRAGVTSVTDFWARMTKGYTEMKIAPYLIEQPYEYVTVDYVAQAVVHISSNKDALGKAFHLVPPTDKDNITSNQFYALIADSLGTTLNNIEYKKWINVLHDYIDSYPTELSNPLIALLPLLTDKVYNDLTTPEFYQNSPQVDSSNTTEFLKGSSIKYSPIDRTLVSKYVTYLQSIKYI